jgi:hypothetical protein
MKSGDGDAVTLYQALQFEALEAVLDGGFNTKALFTLRGKPGLWRRITRARSSPAKRTRPDAELATFGGSVIEVCRDKAVEAELSLAGFVLGSHEDQTRAIATFEKLNHGKISLPTELVNGVTPTLPLDVAPPLDVNAPETGAGQAENGVNSQTPPPADPTGPEDARETPGEGPVPPRSQGKESSPADPPAKIDRKARAGR